MAEGRHGLFTHEVLKGIGAKYGKTAAQVALSDEDMAAIGALDLGHSEIIDHDAPETAKWLNGWKIHD